MRTSKCLRVVAGIAVAMLAACTSESSTNIRTSGINAYLQYSADGTGSSVASATLMVGDSITDFVELSGSDKLTAQVGGSSEALTERKVLGATSYGASFQGQDAEGTSCTISLERGAGDTSAPSSTCTLPAPFTLTAPASGQTFSRADDDITVSYTGANQPDALSWAVDDTNCVGITGASVSSDTGSFTIPKGTLTVNLPDGGVSNASCAVTIKVSRARTGTLDPAYGGGEMRCTQDRTFTFTSAP